MSAETEPTHPNPYIQDLLQACPGLGAYLNLSEGEYRVLGELGVLLRDRRLEPAIESAVYRHLNRMGDGDIEAQNLLVVGVLEILCDSPEGIAAARQALNGNALQWFEHTMQAWGFEDPGK